MFIGAIDSEFRQWLDLNKEAFRGRTLFVGCSGNFTIEQILGEASGSAHGNDVSVYSHFVGHHLAGQPFRWAIKDPAWAWLQPWLEENPAAVVVILFELFRYPPKNAHNKRLYDNIINQWEHYFRKTAERLKHAGEQCHLTSYRSSDIWDFVDEAARIDPDGVMFGFLPFYKGDYEKLYKRINTVLDWDAPGYTIIDQERKAQLFSKICKFDYVLIDDVRHDEYPAVMWKRRSRTKDVILYSNLNVERVFVSQHTACTPVHYPILQDEDIGAITPDSPIALKRVKGPEINYFKNQYMKKTILFTDGPFNFLLFIGGKLFGCAVITFQKFGRDGLYILSDFVVPVDKKHRLAKLALLTLQTVEFRDAVEQILLSHVTKLTTTAFTDAPVSMKYRGIFELVKRGDENGVKFLNYETATGLHDTRGAITKWKTFKKR
ncbi:putative antirestriction adenine methyltransferase [Nevskia soli]|uniref:putative antirestriction adenine methyltransferase n=1 Tax=Nevskia soli TaxID=418856 RepID=UPI0015D94467|nr:hypothetical protein [Nevskia soli]